MKKWIPKVWKVWIKLGIRSLKDCKINFAKSSERKINFAFKVGTTQEIKQGNYFENKVHNFKIAKERIENVVVYPNQVFSFWKIIGNPTEKNKFKKGRNIVNGTIAEEVGGGLCQISTLIYVTALKLNFEIIERYNHSVDIYSEEDRFTPLGSRKTPQSLIENPNITCLAIDISDETQLEQVNNFVSTTWKKVDILINNAGSLLHKPFQEITSKEFQDIYKVNVFAVAELTKICIPYMSK
uniref:SDR family NAD(P)-dependent oxidoreductase n=1 Tax=Flavobacterium sp. TaxID=239 RepID=UPI0040485633